MSVVKEFLKLSGPFFNNFRKYTNNNDRLISEFQNIDPDHVEGHEDDCIILSYESEDFAQFFCQSLENWMLNLKYKMSYSLDIDNNQLKIILWPEEAIIHGYKQGEEHYMVEIEGRQLSLIRGRGGYYVE